MHQICAPTLPGIEALVGTDLIDHTYENLLPLQQGDADSVWGILVDKVRRAIEGIDHPEHLLSLMAGQAFLSDKASLRQQLFQCSNNQPFRPFVDIRHIVVGMLPLHTLKGELFTFSPNISPRSPCNLTYGQREFL